MNESFSVAQLDETVQVIRERSSLQPRIGLILGSGLGGLAEQVARADAIPYNELPNWPVSTVIGHMGRLVLGKLAGKNVAVMQGRAHFYEGYSIAQVGFPIRVLQRLGIEILIVTNAAGAVNPDFEPGDLMLITDHLNLIGMGGANPLRGPNLDEFGPRFPDMSQAYDPALRSLARQVAADLHIPLHEGVYVSLAGPSFETPADLRFLRMAGADAVGMSTIPEVIVARHASTRVLGVSGISNKANLGGNTITTHEEVLEAGRILTPRLTQLIGEVLHRLD